MKILRSLLLALLAGAGVAATCSAAANSQGNKVKLLVVSSYHKEYLWSQETNEGLPSLHSSRSQVPVEA